MGPRSGPVVIDDATPVALLAAGPSALVVGNFDGVHRGHQAVLEQMVADAHAERLAPSVLTFDPHPASVVGRGTPPLLTTLGRRVELMHEAGVERIFVRRFDRAFAAWAPERFVRELVVGALHARVVIVGDNFRFGAKRAGDLQLLRSLGDILGFEARVHPVATDARGPFSSTRARDAIAAGDMEEAERVLGRPHEISGVVVHGDKRGRVLGFPTANVDGVAEMVPPHGIYAVTVDEVDPAGHGTPLAGGVTSIGVRPTIASPDPQRTIETFLFDFEGDLYGRRLRLHLVSRLRDELAFASLEELTSQIARDAADARVRLSAARGR
jgi:riboflavin kinase/FMN adenylyltransferase